MVVSFSGYNRGEDSPEGAEKQKERNRKDEQEVNVKSMKYEAIVL